MRQAGQDRLIRCYVRYSSAIEGSTESLSPWSPARALGDDLGERFLRLGQCKIECKRAFSSIVHIEGGAQRKIQHDMLAIDLEKQKVELAQMQYEAREAIAATRSNHERSET